MRGTSGCSADRHAQAAARTGMHTRRRGPRPRRSPSARVSCLAQLSAIAYNRIVSDTARRQVGCTARQHGLAWTQISRVSRVASTP